MKNNYLSLLCFGAVFNATAIEITSDELVSLKEKINHAIIKFENTESALWAYNISRYENEEGDITSSIEQYSPQANNKWQLKKINGKQPTEKQIKRFSQKKQQQVKTKKEGGDIQLNLRQLINQESLFLFSFDEKNIVMGFNVYLKKLGKDSVGKLQGQLFYQKDKQFIEKIVIWNNAEFSPMFAAEITDLTITFTFSHINGAVLNQKNEMMMKGRFAYFTEINETSLDVFSNYQYQGEQAQ